MSKVNIDDYFQIELNKLGVEMSKSIISSKKKELKQAIENKDANAKIIKEIKQQIVKLGLEVKVSVVVDKILEEDNVVASFFFKRGNISVEQKSNIVKKYILSLGLEVKETDVILFITHTAGSLSGFRNIPKMTQEANKNPNKRYIVYYEGSNPNGQFKPLMDELYKNKNVIKIDEYIKNNSSN